MIRRAGVLAFLLGAGSAFAQADPPPVQSVAKVDLDRALQAAKAQGFDLARLRSTSHGQSATPR